MFLNHEYKAVTLWLFTIFLFVGFMVMVGGITRLTRSGLSIVEWKPVTGVIPPLSQKAWEEEFEKYKQYPEYRKHNQGMSLDEFKYIFFWEFIHRLLGRTVGLVFLLPFLYFTMKKMLRGPDLFLTVLAFILGGLQGLLGWFMVKSGLVDMPRVSHFRLAAHLFLALFIMMYILWLMLYFNLKNQKEKTEHYPLLRNLSWIITFLISVQIIYGAFTAGIRAGYIYNTFPLMGGSFLPHDMFAMQPSWINFFENMSSIQFIHRSLAWLIVFFVPGFYIYSRKFRLETYRSRGILFLTGTAFLQFLLGIFTLIFAVPVSLGVIHQMAAVLLLSLAVYNNFVFTYRTGE